MIANVVFTMQVICHSLSVLSMFLYGLCKNVLVTCVLRISYMLHFDFLFLFLSDIVAKQTG